MAGPVFKQGDKVQNLCRSSLVLTVVAVERSKVRCEARHTIPATPWAPAREVPVLWVEPAILLTHYNPAPIPKIEPIVLDLRTPDMSEVDKLQLFYDGRIPRAELEAAKARDRQRNAERAAALLAKDGEPTLAAAE